MTHAMSLKQEAAALSMRTGLRAEACERWMKHVGLRSVPDLMKRYPGVRHAECMTRAASEIEDYILAG